MIASLFIVACVPPPATPAEPAATAPSGGVAAASGGATAVTCDDACAHIAECGLEGGAGCVAECNGGGHDQETLATFMAASCEEVVAWLQRLPPAGGADAANRGGAGGGDARSYAHSCQSQGVYEVCDGSFCKDHVADGMGTGATVADAALDARQSCMTHMNRMVITENMNNRAAVKRSCEAHSCK